MSVVNDYRKAVMKRYKLTATQAKECVYSSKEDTGGNAPCALAILNLERGHLGALHFYAPNLLDECIELSRMANPSTFIEHVNGAIAAVYDI